MNDTKVGFLDILILLAKGKKFIFFFTLIMCIIAVAYSFLATEKWASSTTVLPLANRNMAAVPSALMNSLGLGLGGMATPFTMNLKHAALLKSRTISEDVVRRFDLIDYFKITEQDTLKAMHLAVKSLHSEMLNILINEENHFMTLRVITKDKYFSREIAQYYLDTLIAYTLNNTNNTGRQKRELLEGRVNEITETLQAILDEVKIYQIEHNIIEIEHQARVAIERYGKLLEDFFTIDLELSYVEKYMPNTIRHRDLSTRRALLLETLSSLEMINPDTPFLVPLRDVTERYLTIQQKLFNIELYKKILETIYPQLELARLEELDTLDKIEIIDLPNLAGQRAHPLRAMICIVTFIISFLFSCGCVLLKQLTSDEDKNKFRELWKNLFR